MTLKERFAEEINAVWESEDMRKWCIKNASVIVELENGDITDIDKPSIQKDFCFGYGFCGVSTQEDMDRAHDMVKVAENSVNYFMERNLEGLNSMIEALEDEHNVVYKFLHYCGQSEDSHLMGISVARWSQNLENEPWRYSNLRQLKELTANERKALIDGYKTARELFIKRLNTYLKKYGLTKVNSWTYLCD